MAGGFHRGGAAVGLVLWGALTGTPVAGEVVVGEAVDASRRHVTFRHTPEVPVESVVVAADFNDWDQIGDALTDPDGDGTWEITLTIAPGAYEYKFVVDGDEWVVDPGNSLVSPDLYGNSLLAVPRIPTEQSALTPLAATGELAPVRITYHHQEAQAVSLGWGINGWQPLDPVLFPEAEDLSEFNETPMQAVSEGEFQIEMALPVGVVLDYVFHISEPFEFWDNSTGEGEDYHTPITGPAEITVFRHGVAEPHRPPPRPWPGWLLNAAALSGVAIGLWLALGGGSRSQTTRWIIALWMALLAFAVRVPNGEQRDWEFDENEYVPVAHMAAQAMAEGNWSALIDDPRVTEHPRLGIALGALSIRITGMDDSPDSALRAFRVTCALLASVCALLIGLRFPLAAALWALFGLGVKYTSIAYLDSAMTLFATACVLAFDQAVRSESDTKARWSWLALSAISAGCAVSSKYLGVVAPIAVALGFAVWIITSERGARPRLVVAFAVYVLIALVAMWLTDWHLWSRDFPARILDRLRFHNEFAHGELVANSDFPWWQPIIWLWNFTANAPAVGWAWLDRAVTVLGLAGITLMTRREPRLAIAGCVTLLFLFLWPTKWPQYEVILLPWLCIGTQITAEILLRGALSLTGGRSEGGEPSVRATR